MLCELPFDWTGLTVFSIYSSGVTGDSAQNMFTASCRESLAGNNISYLL